jgi:hypothetical protein
MGGGRKRRAWLPRQRRDDFVRNHRCDAPQCSLAGMWVVRQGYARMNGLDERALSHLTHTHTRTQPNECSGADERRRQQMHELERHDFALGHPLRGTYRLVARSNELSLVATAVLFPSTERGG